MNLELTDSARLGGQWMAPGNPAVYDSPVLGLQAWTTTPGIDVDVGNQTRVLMSTQQAP